jgi:hypothetical protein
VISRDLNLHGLQHGADAFGRGRVESSHELTEAKSAVPGLTGRLAKSGSPTAANCKPFLIFEKDPVSWCGIFGECENLE